MALRRARYSATLLSSKPLIHFCPACLLSSSLPRIKDNYGEEGTADKAMGVLRSGGVYLLMPHGECYEKKTQGPPCLSAHPKAGVRQLNYVTGPDFEGEFIYRYILCESC